jgi:hypothetical protein
MHVSSDLNLVRVARLLRLACLLVNYIILLLNYYTSLYTKHPLVPSLYCYKSTLLYYMPPPFKLCLGPLSIYCVLLAGYPVP